MKRLLLTLLVLVMFTPGLACTGILCFPKAAMADMPCCPKAKQDPGVKFFKDCSGIDLQGASHQLLAAKQDVQSHDLFLPAAAAIIVAQSAPTQHAIRAPPPEPVRSSFPALYLSTQRLRI